MVYNYEDNTKLRIVLLLNEETNQEIINLNKEINFGIGHDIEFSNTCIPHITLISGKLKRKSNFEKISKIINEKTQQFLKKKLIISFDKYYFSPDKTWLFLSIENNEVLINFIKELRNNLLDYLEISDARHLHVTIAKSKELQSKYELIKNLKIPKKFVSNYVAIGLSGESGILINLIEEYNINLNKPS